MAFSNKVGSQPAQSGNKYSEGAFPGNIFFYFHAHESRMYR